MVSYWGLLLEEGHWMRTSKNPYTSNDPIFPINLSLDSYGSSDEFLRKLDEEVANKKRREKVKAKANNII